MESFALAWFVAMFSADAKCMPPALLRFRSLRMHLKRYNTCVRLLKRSGWAIDMTAGDGKIEALSATSVP